MAPEKNAKSKDVTVRLGLGSVIFAAIITFIGLAWIFFLGVMVGRMYYGADPQLNNLNGQTNIVSQQNSIQNPSQTFVPLQENPENQALEQSTAPVQSKTGTTYHPVIKEDNIADRMNQSQESSTFSDSLDGSPLFTTPPNKEPGSPVVDKAQDTDKVQSADIISEDSIPEVLPSTLEEQTPDFIEKVNDTGNDTHDTSNTLNTMHNDTIKNTEVVESATDYDVDFVEQSTSSQNIVVTDSAEKNNEVTKIADNIDESSKSSTQNSVENQKDETTLNTENIDDSEIYKDTYQLATYKNPDSAHAITQALVEDGLEALTLTEERNGITLYYILVYHQGNASSKEAVEKILAQHHFTTFIVRSKKVQ